MITPYKNRTIDKHQPVLVYRNLTKNCYSLKQYGKVVGHADEVNLFHCKFLVNENGRQRVVKTGKKFVHAYVEGIITSSPAEFFCGQIPIFWRVTYNPKTHKKFELWPLSHVIDSAVFVKLTLNGVYAAEVY